MNKRQKKKREMKERLIRQQEPAIIRITRALCKRRKVYIKTMWRE